MGPTLRAGIGTRLPAFTTSMGRVLLAGLPNEQIERMLKKAGPLQKHTAKSITDPAAMLREIETVRRQGWAMVDQELEMGLRSVAAPVVDCNGEPIAALNIGTHASRWPIQKLTQEVLALLKQTAAAISALRAPEAQAKARGMRRLRIGAVSPTARTRGARDSRACTSGAILARRTVRFRPRTVVPCYHHALQD